MSRVAKGLPAADDSQSAGRATSLTEKPAIGEPPIASLALLGVASPGVLL